MENFRRNVDPVLRRKTNKSLIELNSLRDDYEISKKALYDTENRLEREKTSLDVVTNVLEEARNALSIAQEEIDADYLPEGAQPRTRIHNRDLLLLVMAK